MYASQEPTSTTVLRTRYLLFNDAAVGGIILVRTFHFCSILRDKNLLKIKIELLEHYAVNKNMLRIKWTQMSLCNNTFIFFLTRSRAVLTHGVKMPNFVSFKFPVSGNNAMAGVN
jgi:hypothetical protein